MQPPFRLFYYFARIVRQKLPSIPFYQKVIETKPETAFKRSTSRVSEGHIEKRETMNVALMRRLVRTILQSESKSARWRRFKV